MATDKKPSFNRSDIPGWKDLPPLAVSTPLLKVDKRLSTKADPVIIFKTLLVTLWFDLGVRE